MKLQTFRALGLSTLGILSSLGAVATTNFGEYKSLQPIGESMEVAWQCTIKVECTSDPFDKEEDNKDDENTSAYPNGQLFASLQDYAEPQSPWEDPICKINPMDPRCGNFPPPPPPFA